MVCSIELAVSVVTLLYASGEESSLFFVQTAVSIFLHFSMMHSINVNASSSRPTITVIVVAIAIFLFLNPVIKLSMYDKLGMIQQASILLCFPASG